MAFWQDLVSDGLIDSFDDGSYYSEGQAGEGEYANAIKVAFNATAPGSDERKKLIDNLFEGGVIDPGGSRDYWYGLADGDGPDMRNLENASETFFQASNGAITLAGETPAEPDPDAPTEVETGPGTEDETPAETGTGGTAENTVPILTSKDMKWFFDPESAQWMVSYKLPNSDRSVVFAAEGSQLDAIFGEGQRPKAYETISFADLTQREGVTFAGDIAEVQGTGSFEGEVDRVIALALDEGILPKWAQGSGAVYDLLFIAQSENKSDEWLVDELAKLPEFKTRFPGIETIQATGLTTTEAVTGFLELEQGIKTLVIRDGGNPATINPQVVGDLIAKGHSLTDVTQTFAIFDRLESNAGALEAFNEVLAANGQAPLTAEDQFEFMAGNAPTELYKLWEQSSLHQAAQAAGLNLGVGEAISLAGRTGGLTSFDAAYEGLTVAAQQLLQFRGEVDLGRLEQEDLIDISLGLVPRSGASQADIAREMERAVMSARSARQRSSVNPFTSFSSEGVPSQASLQGARQESA